MACLRRFLLRLYNVFRPEHAEPDLTRELNSHLTLLQDDFQRQGLTPEEARIAAKRAFGGVEHTKDLHRDARSFVWLDDARRDLRYAARLLQRDPLFTLTAAVSLAIGIGANITIFTVANALLFRPPAGVVEPNRLVDIGRTRNGYGFNPGSYPNYLDIRERTTTLDGVYAYPLFPRAMSLGGGGGNVGAERIFGILVTTNYFTVLGAVPAVGRLFGAGDSDHPDASPIAVLSYGFWTRRFNKDPAVVGRTLTLNGRAYTVVGVASEGFQGTGVRAGDVWLSMNMVAVATSQRTAVLTDRGNGWLLIGARLKPGVSLTQAAAEMDAIGRMLEREYPDQNRGTGLRLVASSPVPGMSAPVAVFLALLMGIVSLVLVIACANLTGVLASMNPNLPIARAQTAEDYTALGLVRQRLALSVSGSLGFVGLLLAALGIYSVTAYAVTRRTREIGVRVAMGAQRADVIGMVLRQGMSLVAIGAAIGCVLAIGAGRVLAKALFGVPPIDPAIFAAAMVLFALVGLAACFVPALRATQIDAMEALRYE